MTDAFNNRPPPHPTHKRSVHLRPYPTQANPTHGWTQPMSNSVSVVIKLPHVT